MQTICISQHITFCARIVKTRDKILNYLTLSYPRLPHMPISGRGSSNLAPNEDMMSKILTFCARIVKTRDDILNYLTLSYPRLPHMPISGRGSSNLAANKDMMSKILTNGDTVF